MSEPKKKFFFNAAYLNEFDCFSNYYRLILSKHFYIIEDIVKSFEQFDQKNACQLYVNVNDDFYKSSLNIPVKKFTNENPNIAYASASIEMKTTDINGRGLYAVKKIREAEKIVTEKATILQVNPLCMCEGTHDSLYRCHHCALPINQFLTCYSCDVVIYCSQKCLKDDYVMYHRYECLGLQNHFWSMEPTSYDYIALKMMLYGAYHKFTTFRDSNRYGSEKCNYPTLYNLQSHFNYFSIKEVNDLLYSTLKTLMYLVKRTSFFEDYYKKDTIVEMFEYQSFIGAILLIHHAQAICNQIILNFPNINLGIHFNCVANRGKAICTTVSLLNHSCRPNACLIVNNDVVIVRAIRMIEKDEEITINYYEICPMFSYFERQIINSTFFYFVCKCERCTDEIGKHLACKNCGFYCIDGVDILQNDVKECEICNYKERANDSDLTRRNLVIKLLLELYKKTGKLEYVKQLYEYCDKQFQPKSQMFLSGGLFLCDKYMHQFLYDLETDDPITILKYFMKYFERVQSVIPKYCRYYLAGKIQFYHRFFNYIDKFGKLKPVTSQDHYFVKQFMKDIERMGKELRFYLPRTKMNFYYTMLIQAKKFYSSAMARI